MSRTQKDTKPVGKFQALHSAMMDTAGRQFGQTGKVPANTQPDNPTGLNRNTP